MRVKFDFSSLGIVEGDEKRRLEDYIDVRFFSQRKSYDEYYVDITNCTVDIDLGDLMILAESFKVIVLDDSVVITHK